MHVVATCAFAFAAHDRSSIAVHLYECDRHRTTYDIDNIDITFLHYSRSNHSSIHFLISIEPHRAHYCRDLPHHVDEMTYLSVVDQYDHI